MMNESEPPSQVTRQHRPKIEKNTRTKSISEELRSWDRRCFRDRWRPIMAASMAARGCLANTRPKGEIFAATKGENCKEKEKRERERGRMGRGGCRCGGSTRNACRDQKKWNIDPCVNQGQLDQRIIPSPWNRNTGTVSVKFHSYVVDVTMTSCFISTTWDINKPVT